MKPSLIFQRYNQTRNGLSLKTPSILGIIFALAFISCAGGQVPVAERASSCEKRGQETYLSIKTTLEKNGDTMGYYTLMNVYNAIVQSRCEIPQMDQLLNSLINKRNGNLRVDQMILIFSARALGNSTFPVPGACGIFESILKMDDSRVNAWVISFVAEAIGDYPFDIPDGNRLVDLLEERLDQVKSVDADSKEYFGFHFLPPPQSDFICSYIAGISEQRNREVERTYYYLLIQNNIKENEIEAALKRIHSKDVPGPGEKCLLPMKYLLLNKDSIFSAVKKDGPGSDEKRNAE